MFNSQCSIVIRWERQALVGIFLLIAFTVPLLAHHDVAASYDATRAMTLRGMITRVQWGNPHVWVLVDVQDIEGKVTRWRVQMAATGALTKAGLDMSFMDLTKGYEMEVWPARDGSKIASGRTLIFADGRTFDVGDRWGETKEPSR